MNMVIFESLNFVLDPILDPFLYLGPFWALLLISLLIALIITIVYKLVTDQELMKTLKEDIKEMQKEMKKFKQNPDKMMKIQKKAMEKNMKYMMHSMKPTLITFIPLILIFGWLFTNLAYDPINSGEKFDVYMFFDDESEKNISLTAPEGVDLLSDKVPEIKSIETGEEMHFNNPYMTKKRYGGFLNTKEDVHFAGWRLEGKEGEYGLEFEVDGQQYYKKIFISDSRYAQPIETIEDGVVKGIAVDQGQLIVIDMFGFQLGWFWAYIIFSILFSMALRKILKVY
ncbi:EMC3/TMCO1 family protein [Thermoproteota archaeon]